LRIVLSEAPDGGALLAFVSSGSVDLFERAPASRAFAPEAMATETSPNTEHLPSDVAVAVDDGGGAGVAWREEESTNGAKRARDVVLARTRGADGPFGAARIVASEPAGEGAGIVAVFAGGDGSPFDDVDEPGLQVARGADGRVALAWMRGDPGEPHEARGATIAPDGAISVRALGSPCRRPSGVATLLTAGVPAIAYANNRDTLSGEMPLRGGALHVVRADELSAAPPVASPPPTARVRLTAPRRLRFGQKLAIPVVCDRDCDILVQAVASRRGDLPLSVETGTSARAGATRQVVLDPLSATLVSSRAHGVPLRVTACAPNGSSSTVMSLVQPAVQVPPRPGPIPRDVRARRSGQNIVVTWSIARALPSISFVVVGYGKAVDSTDQPYRSVRGRQRTRFRVVLRPAHPRAIVTVIVSGRTNEPPYRGGTRTVRVR
jgi:hypothetical protein